MRPSPTAGDSNRRTGRTRRFFISLVLLCCSALSMMVGQSRSAVSAGATSRQPVAARPGLAAEPTLGTSFRAIHPGADLQAAHGASTPAPASHLASAQTTPPAPAASSEPKAVAKPRVYLTFDDGPDPRWTPLILSILERHGVHATFFVVGDNVARHPELVARASKDGDSVEDHTWSHADLTRSSPSEVIRQLQACRDLLTSITGRSPWFWRPPYDAFNGKVVAAGASLGMSMKTWDLSPSDWTLPGTGAIVQRVLANVHDGSVVLMHDAGGRDRSQTVAATDLIVSSLLAQGYDLAPL